MFDFLSLLIARRLFDIIEVYFLVVGHTHEDIHGTYGRLLTQIKLKDIFLLHKVIDIYRTCDDHNSFFPYLTDEFLEFKSFVDPHLFNDSSKIKPQFKIKSGHLLLIQGF